MDIKVEDTFTYTVPASGTAHTLNVAAMATPPAYVWEYGLRQILADAHAGAKALAIETLDSDKVKAAAAWAAMSPEKQKEAIGKAADALVEKRIRALLDGTIRTGGTRGASPAGLDFFLDKVLAERSVKYRGLARKDRTPLLAAALASDVPAHRDAVAEARRRQEAAAETGADLF